VERQVKTGAWGFRKFVLLLAGVLAFATRIAPPASAGDLVSELRLGIFDQSVDGSVSESGVAVNVEALFPSLPWSTGHAALDRAIRPRPHIGATINAGGDTSLAYAGLSWTVPLAQDWFFAEMSFGGALHSGPLDTPGVASYGCSWAFRETLSLGIALSEEWRLLGTVEHMSNADLCDRNRGLTNAGLRLGYILD
jgi:hypothetical protein